MPRTRSRDHLHRHRLLRELWLFVPSIYSTLLPTQQWEIHRLYEPSEFFEDDALLAFVKAATTREPSLPNRVGKHWKRLNEIYVWAAQHVGDAEDWRAIERLIFKARALGCFALDRKPPEKGRITASAIVNPQLNYDKLVRALLWQVELQHEGKLRPEADD